ncbi:MAG TPA: AAA family ATPase, partial [Rhizomicrobium sp.]|nr:AAA family ATPase [Rhizomicrobium sp.]
MRAGAGTDAGERAKGERPALRVVTETDSYRQVPYDVEIEQVLIGAVLVNNSVLECISATLQPEHFFDPLHQRVLKAMLAMHGERVIDPLTLAAAMKADPAWAELQCAPHAYLAGLAAACPAMPNVRDYARILRDLAQRRDLIRIGEGIVNSAYDGQIEAPLHEQVSRAETALREIEFHSASLPTVSASSFDGEPVPEREEVVEGLVPKRAVTGLSGDGGTGKSLLALQLAVAIQRGTNWLGRVVFERGPVLYLSAEDDLKEVHRRLYAILAGEQATFTELAGLHIVPLVGEESILGKPDSDGSVSPTALFHALESRIKTLRPVLVILDTLSDVFGGDENIRVQSRQFVSLFRRLCVRFDTTVLLLAHPSLYGINSGSGTSGSTGWSNSLRSRLYLERVKGKDNSEDDPDARILRCKKANYGPTGTEIHLRWQRGTFVPTTHGDGSAFVAANARADRVFLDMLGSYTEEGRNVGPSTGASFAPNMFSNDRRAAG